MKKLLPFFVLRRLPFRRPVSRADDSAPPASAAAKAQGPNVLDAVPEGYQLQAYDDCGVAERQPHVEMKDSYFFTFALSDTDADLKSRSAVFNTKRSRCSIPISIPNSPTFWR